MYTIAHIENDYTEKFGVPRQSGLVSEVTSRVVFEPEFRNPEALRGLEGFTHIWLIWEFSEAKRRGSSERGDAAGGDAAGTTGWDKCDWRPTVRPPRLGGNTRMGVFATRSPFRPNPLGLSCVELAGVEYDTPDGPVILVRGADLMNGTPIFDIKPYIPYADCRPEAKGGFTDENEFEKVKAVIPEEIMAVLSAEEAAGLKSVLEQDPRPAYQRGQVRAYTFKYAKYDVTFMAEDGILTVTSVKKVK
ncbi:MAG: tRNA (N6-threonylcarbamoyladenosine(37)-N6)-methyltransferase TrmO [Lachnospiraceae bacterium]|nr:tRNA (N6-threonylcarbamoyladenosine(37)-N6)-methyltransferase TrmO [Lachnospiraceae bacterium]